MCWHALVFQTLDLLINPVEYKERIVSRDDVWLNLVGAQVLCKSDMTPKPTPPSAMGTCIVLDDCQWGIAYMMVNRWFDFVMFDIHSQCSHTS